MSKIKYSPDKKCRFYSGNHTYRVGRDKYTSVTTFLGTFMEPFDADRIAKIKAINARRNGIKGQGVRYWKGQWKEAAEHGTRTHNLLEGFVKRSFDIPFDSEVTETEERDVHKYRQGEQWLNHYFKCVGEPIVFPELIVYDKDMQLAGQIDLLVERNEEKGVGRVYDLVDYKTNSAIHKTAYKDKTMKPPLSDLPDCSYYKYMLQLSMYAYMLEKQGAKIGDLILLHLQEDKVKPYTMKYDKKSILKLLPWTDLVEDINE
jgi:hypothetical protein